jgi:hypothetical protein
MMFESLNTNTTGVTGGAKTAYPSAAPVYNSGFCGVRVVQSLVSFMCNVL